MRRVSTKVDVFSFGVVMMEVFTGRRPTSGAVEEGGNCVTLPQLVEGAMADGVDAVVRVADGDMKLATEIEERELVAVMEVALSCTRFCAEERPNMNQVLSSLLKLIRDDV